MKLIHLHKLILYINFIMVVSGIKQYFNINSTHDLRLNILFCNF
jgi:hypothetical protein